MSDEGEQGSKANGPSKPFFSGGCGDSTASCARTDVAVGTEVGPFKLCGILGEGGYGIVYLAEQERPIRRRVALKIVKLGMDSRQITARFEAERQALALLDHPNIAHIYDAGTTSGGRPYFAMEFIDGLPITEYCDREKLGLKQRLRLFLQVCSAVEHAHQKGIIHRDLKPSNILVAMQDSKPAVKVIDFGVAKALSQTLTERTLCTEQGQFIGTPDYMSPEQALLDPGGVDTRSDVYSLGVVLYELLTGVLPFDSDTLRSGGVECMRAAIRDHEPRTPSTRLTALGGMLTEVAQCRSTDPRNLTKTLRAELEWIPIKAMRKEPGRRYQSASELAHDVESYLTGEPLSAGPESVLYHAAKLVRKHRAAVAAVIIVVASLLIGLITSTAMYFRAERMRVMADESRGVAEISQAAETAQRQAAERERNRAIEAEKEATRRLTDFYESQGRRYMDAGDLDRAVVLLTEALKNDANRPSTLLLAQECLRTYADPHLRVMTGLVPWKGESPNQSLLFATSPDRALIALMSEGTPTIHVYDTSTGEPRIPLRADHVSKLAFAPGNRHLVVCADDTDSHQSIHLLNLNTGKEDALIRRAKTDIDKLLAFREGILPSRDILTKYYERLVFGPDGTWFAFLDLDDSGPNIESWISLWSFPDSTLYTSLHHTSEDLIFTLIYATSSVYGFEPFLATVDRHSYVRQWSVPDLGLLDAFPFDIVDGTVSSAAAVGLDPNGALFILDRHTNRLIRTFPDTVAYGWNPDTSRLLTQTIPSAAMDRTAVTKECRVDLWRTSDGQHIAQLSDRGLVNWHFSPDGKFLVTEHSDFEVHVWLTTNGGHVFTIPAQADQEVADIGPHSKWLITRDYARSGVIHAWDLNTGQRYRPYATAAAGKDIGAESATEALDRVFRHSRKAPRLAVRFNGDGSALVCPEGLLPFHPDTARIERITRTVAREIPFRLQDGRIRPATETEMRLAYVEHFQTGGLDAEASKAAESLLWLASDALDHNDLPVASQFMREYLSLAATGEPEIARSAEQLRERLANTYYDLGDREERCGHHRAAVENYTQALRFRDDRPEILSRLAWVLATSPDRMVYDSVRAVAESRRACDSTGWANWECLSVHAAACAAHGAFQEAVRWQTQALQLLPSAEEGRWGENLRLRTRLFEARSPYDRTQFYNLPEQNLLCWWTFEDANDGVIRDRSGRGHDAAIESGVRQIRDNGRAVLQFYGSESAVRCPSATDLNVRDALTVCAWVKYSPLDGPDWQRQQVAGKGHAWALSVESQTHRAVFECEGLNAPAAAPYSQVIGKMSLNDGRWHQIAGVYDSRTLAVYVDGRLDGAVDASGLLLVASQGITLGKDIYRVMTWRELMREVRVYDRALTAREMAELYEATR